MWCSNADVMFPSLYVFKAEFVTIVSLKVPSGGRQTHFVRGEKGGKTTKNHV